MDVRVVDIFAGCGGLSLGFELFQGDLNFEVVLAADNWAPAVRCYNANHPAPSHRAPTARNLDLTWFAHESEILLYYLTHFAGWKPDRLLRSALHDRLGVGTFFASLGLIDVEFSDRARALQATREFRLEYDKLPVKLFNLAIFNAFLGRLGVGSLKVFEPACAGLPWATESSAAVADGKSIQPPLALRADFAASLGEFWDFEVSKMIEASEKVGTGQHSVVAGRLQSLVSFLRSDVGSQLREIWISWRSARDAVRASYCAANEVHFRELYNEDRRVHLLLGGPPCKGFSRIGRARIESLRNQGVHAWACKDFGDERNALLEKYVLFLSALAPDAFIFENVAHFQSSLRTPNGTLDASEMLRQLVQELSADRHHYAVASSIVQARKHAVPQDRDRFILLGLNEARVNPDSIRSFFTLNTYGEEVPLLVALQGLDQPAVFDFQAATGAKPSDFSRAYTLIDESMPTSHVAYLRWIRQRDPLSGDRPSTVDAHIVRKLRPDDSALLEKFATGKRWMDYKLKRSPTVDEFRFLLLKVKERGGFESGYYTEEQIDKVLKKLDDSLMLRLLIEDFEAPLGEATESHLLADGYLSCGNDKYGDWFERLKPDRPSKTIVAHIGKDTYSFFHPFAPRAISIRETARIQSFPDFFSFGSVGVVDGYQIIGNAVPPLMAHALATSLDKMHAEIGVFGLSADREVVTARRVVAQLELGLGPEPAEEVLAVS